MSAKRAAVQSKAVSGQWSSVPHRLIAYWSQWLTNDVQALCAIENVCSAWLASRQQQSTNSNWQTVFLLNFIEDDLKDPLFADTANNWKQRCRLRFVTLSNWQSHRVKPVVVWHRQRVHSMVIAPAQSVLVPSRVFIATTSSDYELIIAAYSLPDFRHLQTLEHPFPLTVAQLQLSGSSERQVLTAFNESRYAVWNLCADGQIVLMGQKVEDWLLAISVLDTRVATIGRDGNLSVRS